MRVILWSKTLKRNWSNTTETHITNVSEGKVSRRGLICHTFSSFLPQLAASATFRSAYSTMPNGFMPLDAEHLGTIAATKPPRCGRRLQPVPSGQVYVEAFTALTLTRCGCPPTAQIVYEPPGRRPGKAAKINSYTVECKHSCALNNSSQKSAAPFRWTTTWASRRNVQCHAHKKGEINEEEFVQSRCAMRDRPESWQSPPKR